MNGLEVLGRKQFGLVSREQAIRAGLSAAAVRWRLERGEWEAIQRTVYRFRGAPLTWSQKAMAVTLLAGPGSALSHQTAGFLFGLDGLPSQPPCVLDITASEHRRVRVPDVRLHQHSGATLPRSTVRGLTVTTLPRTLLDLATTVPEDTLELAFDSARRKNRGLDRWLEIWLATLPRQHRGRTTLLDLLASRHSPLDSAFEVKLSRALRRSTLPRPVAGLAVYDLAGYVMKVDFAWPTHLVALHADSHLWHQQRTQFERDVTQRARLVALGWTNVTVTSRSLSDPHWSAALSRLLQRHS